MSLFSNEVKVDTSNSALSKLSLQDLEKGESVYFYLADVADLNSAEYGDFKAFQGIKLDENAASEIQSFENGEAASFIPNTMLLNAYDSGGLNVGKTYRIEKAWNKGDVYKGKPSRGYGYNIFEIKTAVTPLKAKEIFANKKSDSGGEISTPAKTSAAVKPRR